MIQFLLKICFIILVVSAAANADTMPDFASSQLDSGYIRITPQDNLFYLLARLKTAGAPLVI